MALIDVPTAKVELRVDHDVEDAAIQRKLDTAQEQAEAFLGRRIYESDAARTAAIAAAPAALAAASTAYDVALAAALDLSVQAERDLASAAAIDAYRDALKAYTMAVRGLVVNKSIETAILVITASLWEHRGDEDAIEGIPKAAERFLWKDREGIGV